MRMETRRFLDKRDRGEARCCWGCPMASRGAPRPRVGEPDYCSMRRITSRECVALGAVMDASEGSSQLDVMRTPACSAGKTV